MQVLALPRRQLHFHFSLSCIGEVNGNPLQCSCLENPRDGGAWWAAISGVAQSQTRLKRLSSSSSRRPYVFSFSFPVSLFSREDLADSILFLSWKGYLQFRIDLCYYICLFYTRDTGPHLSSFWWQASSLQNVWHMEILNNIHIHTQVSF